MHAQDWLSEVGAISFRVEKFTELCEARGLTDRNARAAHVGVHRWTMRQLEARETRPSERFVAQALIALGVKFEDLFEVEVVAAGRRSA